MSIVDGVTIRIIPDSAVGFNQHKGPFKDVKVRQAAQYATDRDSMAKAKSLLKEAGYPDGLDVSVIVRSTATEQRAAETIKNRWDAVGLRTNLQVVERVALFAKMAALEFEAGVWRGDSPLDPDVNKKRLATDGNMNRSVASDPELDKCLDEGGAEMDAKKRHDIYRRCQTILFDGAYSLHGYAVQVNRVLHKSVKGLRDKHTSMLLCEIWLDR